MELEMLQVICYYDLYAICRLVSAHRRGSWPSPAPDHIVGHVRVDGNSDQFSLYAHQCMPSRWNLQWPHHVVRLLAWCKR